MVNKTDISTTIKISDVRHNNMILAENKFGLKNELHSCTQDRKNQLSNLTNKILKTSTTYKQGIHPRPVSYTHLTLPTKA